MDNTASTYGGVLYFRLDLENKCDIVEKLSVHAPINLVLANCGISVNTAEVVAYKNKQVAANPAKFEKIFEALRRQAKHLRAALSRSDLARVGKIMNAHHRILRDLHFSHERLEVLIDIANLHGVLGAKLTGGGRGGYMVALTANSRQQKKIASAIEKEGFETLRVAIGSSST